MEQAWNNALNAYKRHFYDVDSAVRLNSLVHLLERWSDYHGGNIRAFWTWCMPHLDGIRTRYISAFIYLFPNGQLHGDEQVITFVEIVFGALRERLILWRQTPSLNRQTPLLNQPIDFYPMARELLGMQ